MGAEGIPNYQAVLDDLKARRAQLDSAIAAIEAIMGLASTSTTTSAPSSGALAPDAFFSMSIPDATKKLLTMMKRRLSTNDIMRYLKQGGLPEPAYNTLYAVLRRRQSQVGDIINVNGEWGLKEWTPNWKPPVKKATDKPETEKTDADNSQDAAEAVLEEQKEENGPKFEKPPG